MKREKTLYFVSVLLLIVNVFLIIQNLNLRAKIDRLNKIDEFVKEGYFFDNIYGKNLEGDETILDFSQNDKTILLFFRTTCGYCQKQMVYWKKLVSSIDLKHYKVVAITTENNVQAIESYIRSYNIQDWDFLIVDPEQAKRLKLLVTPITIVVDNKGQVEKVWIGLWQARDIESAGKYFQLDFSSNKSE